MICLFRRHTALRLCATRYHVLGMRFKGACIRTSNLTSTSASYSGPYTLHRNFGAFSDQGATIYALSTAPGRAALAIIRCSGSASLSIYEALCPGAPQPKPRCAALRVLRHPTNPKDILDPGALVLFFPGHASATGEDVLELHVHGGPATVRAVLAGVGAVNDQRAPKQLSAAADALEGPVRPRTIRPAEPGEFTQRAFQNARLSLPEVEALSATLSAETESQRRAASGSGSSSFEALAARYESWRETLLAGRGELEALIDFAEDQHFDDAPSSFISNVASCVLELRTSIQRAATNAARGELLRTGVSVALLGPPNAGKSSLLNATAGRDAAIVSDEAGTTRDVVDVTLDIAGFACRFGDLAGLRAGDVGAVEKEGMRRARERATSAPIVVIVLPASLEESGSWRLQCNDEIAHVVAQLDMQKQHVLLAANKIDLVPDGHGVRALQTDNLPVVLRRLPIHGISCRPEHPTGVQPLLEAVAEACHALTDAVTGSNAAEAELDTLGLAASERQRVLLLACLGHLDAFLQRSGVSCPAEAADGLQDDDVDIVLAAEDLRSAADCLGRLAGRGEAGDVEEVLGVVFEKFCVGK